MLSRITAGIFVVALALSASPAVLSGTAEAQGPPCAICQNVQLSEVWFHRLVGTEEETECNGPDSYYGCHPWLVEKTCNQHIACEPLFAVNVEAAKVAARADNMAHVLEIVAKTNGIVINFDRGAIQVLGCSGNVGASFQLSRNALSTLGLDHQRARWLEGATSRNRSGHFHD